VSQSLCEKEKELKNMNNNQNNQPTKLNGNLNQAAGTVKETAGKILNNGKMQGEGANQAAAGRAEKTMAGIKESVKTGVHVAGDAVERIGDKVAQAGFDKAGKAIRNAGDKLEHSAD
jgi:uncharacterized protein YjbJ (UPF0337 family)